MIMCATMGGAAAVKLSTSALGPKHEAQLSKSVTSFQTCGCNVCGMKGEQITMAPYRLKSLLGNRCGLMWLSHATPLSWLRPYCLMLAMATIEPFPR